MLVSNKTLSEFARIYGFHERVRTNVAEDRSRFKIVADCFEAYIGAIVLDAEGGLDVGYRTAREWLERLFEPKIREMAVERARVSPVDKMAKQSLNALVGGNTAQLTYTWTGGGGGNNGGYWITVAINGWGFKDRAIGKGWGTNKSYVFSHIPPAHRLTAYRDAELRAAMKALADTAMIEEIAAIKLKVLGPKPPPREKVPKERVKAKV